MQFYISKKNISLFKKNCLSNLINFFEEISHPQPSSNTYVLESEVYTHCFVIKIFSFSQIFWSRIPAMIFLYIIHSHRPSKSPVLPMIRHKWLNTECLKSTSFMGYKEFICKNNSFNSLGRRANISAHQNWHLQLG